MKILVSSWSVGKFGVQVGKNVVQVGIDKIWKLLILIFIACATKNSL